MTTIILLITEVTNNWWNFNIINTSRFLMFNPGCIEYNCCLSCRILVKLYTYFLQVLTTFQKLRSNVTVFSAMSHRSVPWLCCSSSHFLATNSRRNIRKLIPWDVTRHHVAQKHDRTKQERHRTWKYKKPWWG